MPITYICQGCGYRMQTLDSLNEGSVFIYSAKRQESAGCLLCVLPDSHSVSPPCDDGPCLCSLFPCTCLSSRFHDPVGNSKRSCKKPHISNISQTSQQLCLFTGLTDRFSLNHPASKGAQPLSSVPPPDEAVQQPHHPPQVWPASLGL